jgi:hypothetical protein
LLPAIVFPDSSRMNEDNKIEREDNKIERVCK